MIGAAHAWGKRAASCGFPWGTCPLGQGTWPQEQVPLIRVRGLVGSNQTWWTVSRPTGLEFGHAIRWL